jgi:voltage-gated potassium channel
MRRTEHPLLRFRLAAILLAIVFVIGIAGYMLIDGWSLLDSFYMVITTIATVGYGEVHPQGEAGRLFTSGIIVFGVATMLYGFGVFAQTLTDNAFGEYRRERRLQRDLDQLREHFIICGYGRMGTQIVAEFEHDHTPYVVIDQTAEALDRIRAERRLHIEGDASNEDILKLAGIGRARGLISAVDSDERAVYIVLAARALNPNIYILARAGRPESIRRLELAGATRTISPYLMAGHRMAELALRPAMVDFLDSLHHGEAGIGVEEMIVEAGSKANGRSLQELGLLAADVAKVLAVRRADGTVNISPPADTKLQDGDLLIALGTEDQLFASASRLVDRPMNRSQALAIMFFVGATVAALVIWIVAPATFGSAPLPVEVGFGVALVTVVVFMTAAILLRWRWTFWLVVLAFLAGILRVPATALELNGAMPKQGPDWYLVVQGAIGIVQFVIGLLLVRGYRRAGVWGAF